MKPHPQFDHNSYTAPVYENISPMEDRQKQMRYLSIATAGNVSGTQGKKAFLGNVRGMGRSFFNLRTLAMSMATVTALPILILFSSLLHPEPAIWKHIIHTLLDTLLTNTLVLCSGVVVVTGVVGTVAAWVTAVCEFPGRKFFTWALMLPLSIPTYVFAFVFMGLLDFTGPVQTSMRMLLPGAHNWFPDIRSPLGVICVLSLALYPYVYLLARNAFRTQGIRALEAAAMCGLSPGKAFFKVALPMAWPWVVGGLMLVLMETLSDFGAVSIFNYDTLTTAIYKAWFGFFSLNAAAQLSSVLLVVVSIVVVTEKKMRTRIKYHQVGRVSPQIRRIRLSGQKKWITFALLSLLFLLGFFIPFIQLISWSMEEISLATVTEHMELLSKSLFFATSTAITVAAMAICLVYIQRYQKDNLTSGLITLATMGYALPGTVLAVGIITMVTAMDRSMAILMGGPLFQGTVVIVILGCAVRFMTLGFNSISSAMERITPHVDEASATLGVIGWKRLGTIHVPLLKNGLATALILVFVDVMKEMPITLMTRPFGWDTLAVRVFELTSEGEWQRAALPATFLVLAGLLPLILVTKKSE